MPSLLAAAPAARQALDRQISERIVFAMPSENGVPSGERPMMPCVEADLAVALYEIPEH